MGKSADLQPLGHRFGLSRDQLKGAQIVVCKRFESLTLVT